MKHIIITALAILLSCIALNAQTVEQVSFDTNYKQLKNVRTSGIVIMSVGAPAVAVGTGFIAAGIASAQSSAGSAAEGTIEIGSGLILGAVGIVLTACGATMYGIANNKMKRIVPASNGVGLAYVF